MNKKYLTKKSENISQWYLDLMELAELSDYSPVKGCMVIRPYGFALWELIQDIFNKVIKKHGVQNAYFPLFIPNKLLQKEKSHIEGFNPELAIVTIGGGEKLDEPLVVRPTSETIMYQMFSQWIHSYHDLPLKINQWANVVRWEKRTYPFLRTTEFLWQEGHTVHQTEAEADAMARQALGWYQDLYERYYGISVYVGIKSESEKFAGAKRSYSVELVMPDGKALQGATSHNLGQNFAKAFDIKYSASDNTLQYAWQTSWGLSTRSLGGLFMIHGDDQGLVLPPKIAPYQIVILPIHPKNEINESLVKHSKELAVELEQAGYRVHIDTQTTKSLGWRRSNWEVKGVPLRLEIGLQEMEKGVVLMVSRDDMAKQEKQRSEIVGKIPKYFAEMQTRYHQRTVQMKAELLAVTDSYDEFKRIMAEDRKFIKAHWCEDPACEKAIKDETKATTRVLQFEELDNPVAGKCIYCGKPAHHRWLFAQAY